MSRVFIIIMIKSDDDDDDDDYHYDDYDDDDDMMTGYQMVGKACKVQGNTHGTGLGACKQAIYGGGHGRGG